MDDDEDADGDDEGPLNDGREVDDDESAEERNA